MSETPRHPAHPATSAHPHDLAHDHDHVHSHGHGHGHGHGHAHGHGHDHDHGESLAGEPRLRRVLWLALGLNATMFVIELAGGLRSGSVALWADALDFAGDAASYAMTLWVLGLGLLWRARAAWLKAWAMGLFGAVVLLRALWQAGSGQAPEPLTMGWIGALALLVNLGVALMLYAFRTGDANLRSVWLCSRNDAIGNLAVMAAALGVFGTGTAWPDLIVAALMAGLGLKAAAGILPQAHRELQQARRAQALP